MKLTELKIAELKLFEKIMYPVLIIFVIWAIYISRVNLQYFELNLVNEDGIFQWLIFSTLIFASALCFYRANILKPFRGSTFSFCLAGLGLIFFAFAMDEISWGQSLIGFESPGFFKTYNTKEQLNIHHLVILGFHVSNLVFTFAIKILATFYFLVLPFLYTKFAKVKIFFNKMAIPLPRYTQTAAYVIFGILTGFIPSVFNYVIFEFGFYWILVLMMYHPLNDEAFTRVSLQR